MIGERIHFDVGLPAQTVESGTSQKDEDRGIGGL